MKQIYLIDEHISSKQNGVGTYVRHFAQLFDVPDCRVNVLSFNEEVNEFCFSIEGDIRKISIPFCAQGDFLSSGDFVFPLLSLYIEDKEDNVFFVNHSPSASFIRAIRTNFPKSKIVFTIHDQGWTVPLLGNSKALVEIQNNRLPKGLNRSIANFVKKYCIEEKRMYRMVDAIICLSNSTILRWF